MSRRVSQSFTLSFAELKFILSILCVTLRFISEPLRENKNYFLVIPSKPPPDMPGLSLGVIAFVLSTDLKVGVIH
jgi:hypothetical protein